MIENKITEFKQEYLDEIKYAVVAFPPQMAETFILVLSTMEVFLALKIRMIPCCD